MSIDKKQYLFEAKLNEKLGRANMDICKKLCKLCPEYKTTYIWIRKEALANNMQLKEKDGDKDKALVEAFNDNKVSDADFIKTLSEATRDDSVIELFAKKVRRIGEKEEKIDMRKKVELSFAA